MELILNPSTKFEGSNSKRLPIRDDHSLLLLLLWDSPMCNGFFDCRKRSKCVEIKAWYWTSLYCLFSKHIGYCNCLLRLSLRGTLFTRKSYLAVFHFVQAVFGSVVTFSVATWCIHKKGPLFVTMFNPLGIAIAAFMSVIFLGDTLHVGR